MCPNTDLAYISFYHIHPNPGHDQMSYRRPLDLHCDQQSSASIDFGTVLAYHYHYNLFPNLLLYELRRGYKLPSIHQHFLAQRLPGPRRAIQL